MKLLFAIAYLLMAGFDFVCAVGEKTSGHTFWSTVDFIVTAACVWFCLNAIRDWRNRTLNP